MSRVGLHSNVKVLVADDELACREAVRFFLEHFGLACDCAADGTEVLRLAQKNFYSIALLDLAMGAMSGIEAARCIRARERAMGLAPMPIVALTGREEDLEECLEAGFDEIVLKPVRLVDLGHVLEQFLPGFSAKLLHTGTAH